MVYETEWRDGANKEDGKALREIFIFTLSWLRCYGLLLLKCKVIVIVCCVPCEKHQFTITAHSLGLTRGRVDSSEIYSTTRATNSRSHNSDSFDKNICCEGDKLFAVLFALHFTMFPLCLCKSVPFC